MDLTLQNTINFVKGELAHAEGGHDWFHTERVWKNALRILETESEADKTIVILAALLHDIADSKFHHGDETIGPQKARLFLEKQNVNPERIRHIVKIIENISFKGGNSTSDFHSKELEIVRDADRLDALGAIGIARTFNYGGYKNREIYNPDISPKSGMTVEEYKASTAPTLNHFYEKLLLLKDKMHTETAKHLAEKRHRFMEDFLAQFYAEWNSEK